MEGERGKGKGRGGGKEEEGINKQVEERRRVVFEEGRRGDMERGGGGMYKTLAQDQAPYLPHRAAWPTLLDLHVPCGT